MRRSGTACRSRGARFTNIVTCWRMRPSAERLHDEITADYTEMIYAATPDEIAARRKAFIRKWRLKHSPVARSLEEAGDRLFTFAHLPTSQWKSARTTNAIERLHEELKRRIKTQTVLPSADTAAMLFWAFACFRPNQHAQSRRLAYPGQQDHRLAG
jgi:transposase-like protein